MAFVLSACAKHYEPLAMPAFSQKLFSVKKEQSFLLVLAQENGSFHFVLTDTLGAPKIKKDFEKGEFKSVAFLPPNDKFDPLFYEILRQIKHSNEKLEFSFKGYEVKEL